jgi:hypothetical protein
VKGEIAGRILPDPKGGKPLFQVMRGYHAYGSDEMAGVRPCAHPSYILDPDWMTVTCGECKERLEPFAVLIKYSEWWSEMDHRRDHAEAAAYRLNVAQLRHWSRIGFLTNEEKAEVDQWLKSKLWSWSPAYQKEAEELTERFDKLAKERRETARQERQQKRQRREAKNGEA